MERFLWFNLKKIKKDPDYFLINFLFLVVVQMIFYFPIGRAGKISIGLFISLNFIFFKINITEFDKNYKKYNFYFYFLSKIVPVFFIFILIVRSDELKFIGLIYLLFSVIFKIIDFIKFLNYFDKKEFK